MGRAKRTRGIRLKGIKHGAGIGGSSGEHQGRGDCLSSSVQNPASISVGSMRDAQALARHSSLQQTQKYTDAMSGTSTAGKKI